MASVRADSWDANSAFGSRALQAGGHLVSLQVESHRNDRMMHDDVEASYTFRLHLNHELDGIDDFEAKFLGNREYDEMKRIINDNPELKVMYEKYKIMDKLAGK